MHDVLPASKKKETIWFLRRLVSLSDAALGRFLPNAAVLAEGENVATAFPWIERIDSHIALIRSEAEDVLKTIHRLPRFGEVARVGPGANIDTQWKLYPFIVMGRSLPSGIPTPVTRLAVRQIPGLVNAFYSILPSHTRLRAHRGTSRLLLRCHVGLCIPRDRDRCFFVVDGHKHVWQIGHKLLFDQTFEHEAVNDTEEDRLVLILDVVRPELAPPVRWLVLAVTYALGFHPEARSTLQNFRRALASLPTAVAPR